MFALDRELRGHRETPRPLTCPPYGCADRPGHMAFRSASRIFVVQYYYTQTVSDWVPVERAGGRTCLTKKTTFGRIDDS